MAGGVTPFDAKVSGVGGFMGETPPVICVFWGGSGIEWELWEGSRGLAPPADGAAGGVNHMCSRFVDGGGFINEPPLTCSTTCWTVWKGEGFGMLPPTSIDAGGVGAAAGEPFGGLPAENLSFNGCCGGVQALHELEDDAPPAADVAGGGK